MNRHFAAAVLLWLVLPALNALALSVPDSAVQVSSTVQISPPQITLSWPAPSSNPSGYTVFRKLRDDASFTQLTSSPLSGSATQYVDTTVSVGTGYEYKITTGTKNRFGMIYTGIQVPLTDNRGKIILILDSTFTSVLSTEINQLVQDLMGDGWTVIQHTVNPTDTPASVKALISADYSADTANVKSVFLLGHIPVPYSGDIVPDGHTSGSDDHVGAYPCDGWYGDMSGSWTDTTVNDSQAGARESIYSMPPPDGNHNVPGDGKFDQSTFPVVLKLQVGRVDLHDLPRLQQSIGLDEQHLLQQYLNKDHSFRMGGFNVQRRGIIDDGFGSSIITSGDAVAANGWRNFAAMFGAGQVQAATWDNTLHSNTYLCAYACGLGFGYGFHPGPNNSETITTYEFGSNDYKAVFFLHFASFTGDWDTTDNMLRAPLGTPSFGLASVWAGNPNWFLHHMGLGETIGFSTLVTQNNKTLYDGNSAANQVHVALMGDPALRLHPVIPPSNLSGNSSAVLTWTASTDTNIQGYHVYRANTAAGPFARLTTNLVGGTSYTDTSAASGTYTYMVRAVKLESTPSGSYFNPSQGITASVQVNIIPGVFTLTVVNGSGGGNIASGTVVTITANTPPAGQAFLNWTGATVANSTASSTTLVMPNANTTVTANYGYTLTVVSGTGSGVYSSGQTVSISANTPPAGQAFLNWTGATVANSTASSTTLVMPNANTTVTANYGYTLSVVNGSGSGVYASGQTVNISANTPPTGQVFDKWTGATVANASLASTTLVMPSASTTVTANYKAAGTTFTLTVNNGSGGGSYAAGTVVSITANAPPSGQTFMNWTGATVAAQTSSTTLVMPSGNTTITANYGYSLTVNSGSGSGVYASGAVVNISAATPPAGQTFVMWQGFSVAGQNTANTTLTMPSSATTITATYGYVLTVVNGSGTGNYVPGQLVNISAGTPPAGQVFVQWTGGGTAIVNPSVASTQITMPASNTTITATFGFTLTVVNGTGSGSYAAGTTVSITANTPPTGQVFDTWTGATVANPSLASTTLVMPNANATVTANYKKRHHNLTVNAGTGSGSYEIGALVTISSDAPPSGQVFDSWSGTTVASSSSPSTTLVMPDADATVTANFAAAPANVFALTVVSGSGSGSYAAGTVVSISALAPPQGQIFGNWTGASVDQANSPSTTLTMPASNAVVTANYVTAPANTFALTVVGGSGSGAYTTGTVVNISAGPAPSGQVFDSWSGAVVADANSATTTIAMPALNTVVNANYKIAPVPQFTSPPVIPSTSVAGGAFNATVVVDAYTIVTWDFGDGTVLTGTTVSHTYLVPGIYTVTVTATSPGGTISTQAAVFVGAGAGSQPGDTTAILVGGTGLSTKVGNKAKIVCNFAKPDMSMASAVVKGINFASTLNQTMLSGKTGTLILGSGATALQLSFTMSKTGKGSGNSLPAVQVNLKNKSIAFICKNNTGINAMMEASGATFSASTRKSSPVSLLLPATLQVGTDIFVSVSFRLNYQQNGHIGFSSLIPSPK